MVEAPALRMDDVRAAALIRSQFPELAEEKIVYLAAAGTDNHIFRIGNNLCARFPKVSWAAQSARRETDALPRFQTSPLAVPQVYGIGAPGEDYPYEWSILSWLPGAPYPAAGAEDQLSLAAQLAEFLKFVRSVPPDKTYLYGAQNNWRGAPLTVRASQFQASLSRLPHADHNWVNRVWTEALKAGTSAQDTWLHGDVHPGNVLIKDGLISAVIDWGLSGVGDPACDLLAAWAMFEAPARNLLRQLIGADDAEWLRGAGWALSMAVIYLPYAYEHGLETDMSEKMIMRLMEDFA